MSLILARHARTTTVHVEYLNLNPLPYVELPWFPMAFVAFIPGHKLFLRLLYIPAVVLLKLKPPCYRGGLGK
jgi:hypothetical protein